MSIRAEARFSDHPHGDATGAEDTNLRRRLYQVGALAATTISALLLLGIVDIVTAGWQPAISPAWLAPFQNNWLAVLFKLNAGLGAPPDALSVLSRLDLAIIALFCPVFLALHLALRRASAAWSLVAASLPFLGIPVFLITGMAGRSALLLAGLIISAVMLRVNIFAKATAYAGILAGALLLFGGDLGTAIFSSSPIIAVLVAIGYALWVIWFGIVARGLFRLGQGAPKEGAGRKGWGVGE